MMPFCKIAMLRATVSALPQVAWAAPLCEGNYMSAVTGVSPAIQGKVTGVPNPYRQQPVRVEVQDGALL